MSELLQLAERCDGLKFTDNALDVQIEIALFVPDKAFRAVRANSAGTKVIYTTQAGDDVTFRAMDWTKQPRRTAAALRARDAEQREARSILQQQGEGNG